MAILPFGGTYTRMFFMTLSSDHLSPATGKTPVVTISKAGAAFATKNEGTAIAEVANGWYTCLYNATDLNTSGDLAFHAAVATCDNTDFVDQVGMDFGPTQALTAKSLVIANSAGDAVQFTSSGSNGDALQLTANGSGHGMNIIPGATGNGIKVIGGATSGDAIAVSGTAGNANALSLAGQGSANGLLATAGATGIGISAVGGATSGSGIKAVGTAGNATALELVGQGSADGLKTTGGATGNGINAVGGGTTGDGFTGSKTGASNAIVSPAMALAIHNTARAAELSAVPSQTVPSHSDMLAFLFERARNVMTETATTEILKKADGTTTLGTATNSDNGTTFTRGASA